MSEWIDNNGAVIESPPEGAVGFIYLITRNDTGRQYVGKKLLKFTRTKTVKGKKKKVRVESDWKTYFGSNTELNDEVKSLGESNFTRQILRFCYSKSECNYLETEEIFIRGALKTDKFYNSWVSCKITKKHVESALKKHTF